jgi:hypothetical protein
MVSLLISCTTAVMFDTVDSTKQLSVPLLESSELSIEYKVIGIVYNLTGTIHNINDIVSRLKNCAYQNGGDAIIELAVTPVDGWTERWSAKVIKFVD